MKFHIPIQLPSLANARMNWRRMAKLKRHQKTTTKVCMNDVTIPPLPLVVTITKVGPSKLDDDNLAGACKYIRDQIAAAVGVDDGSDLYTWVYRQRRGDHGVDVEITTRL